jgi:succinate dehydrogenase / fumarate reductase, cytochrome b subunit
MWAPVCGATILSNPGDDALQRYNPGFPMSTAATKRTRPKYLSLPAILFQIRLPLPGWVSILHRVSGALLVLPFTAWLLYLLDMSLASEEGFEAMRSYLATPLVKLGLLVFAWAYCHHLLAGIRYLLLDLNKGIELRPARISSVAVLVVSLILTLFAATRIW